MRRSCAVNSAISKMLFVGILLFALIASCSCDLGDRCANNGKCILVSQCKLAVDALKKRQHHGLERCGFEGYEEMVCCNGDSDERKAKNLGKLRKSMIACSSFQNDMLDIKPSILNGERAWLGEFPHMAALGYEDDITDSYSFQCGGSLISDSFVLTAAHCLVTQDNKLPKIVRFGIVDLTGKTDKVEPQDVPVAKTYPHDNYSWFARVNDIALVQLSKPVVINTYIRPICLFIEDSDPNELVVAGWGKTENKGQKRISKQRDGPIFLFKTALSAVSVKECNAALGPIAFGRSIFETQICAKSNDSIIRDTCEGASGGPLQLEQSNINGEMTVAALVGVTSYGVICGSPLPSIYTRVSKYLDWIEQKVWP